jgi:hypothetical protein
LIKEIIMDIAIVMWYIDPGDPDYGTNQGFEEFTDEKLFLNWVNEMVKYRPRIKIRAYNVRNKINLQPIEVVKEFVIK